MPKVTLTNVSNISGAEATAIATINANWALIADAIEGLYSLDGTSPNSLTADLDMNSNQILNLPAATSDTDPVRKGEVSDLLPSLILQAGEPSVTNIDGSLWIDSDSTDLDVYTETSGAWVDSGVNLKGATGAQGATGASAGISYTFSTTTTASDPGSGILRFNNATPASVTEVYIDYEDASANNLSSYLATWDDTDNNGTLIIYQGSDLSRFLIGTVTSVTDSTGYYTIGVTVTSSGTLPGDALGLSVSFVPAGNNGAAGTNGTNGTNGADGADGAARRSCWRVPCRRRSRPPRGTGR